MKSQTPLTAAKTQVPQAFNGVSKSYDWLTGLNPGYKKHLRWSAERLSAPAGARLLDLCCGTGLSTEALRDTYSDAAITGLDASEGMLARARRKSLGASYVLGDATDPAALGCDGPYDGILMAYGIRNVPNADLCLRNLIQILKPGGRIVFHEYSVADSALRKGIWNAVSLAIVRPGGLITAPKSNIYSYLQRSVNEFDGVRAFESRLGRAGFVNIRTEGMDGWQTGIVHSFIAERPA
ncbi:MAG: ubiquinone/menaquinone biosynthesis C-methylase UbiE [Polyangiales bacterium]